MKKFIIMLCIAVLNCITVNAEVDIQTYMENLKNKIQSSININRETESGKLKEKSEEKDITMEEKDGIYIIKINTSTLKGELKPYYVVNLTTNYDVYKQTEARLVVNAGFFDPKNEQTVSYLTLDGKQILDPHRNKNLMENIHLQPYMDKILNRSEFRILQSNTSNEKKYDIVPHNEPCPQGYKIIHSIQGGPGLVPDIRLVEEFFVLTDKTGKIVSESASSLCKYARTLVGIKENNVYFVIASNTHPVTLPEAAEILQNLGMEKAMAFDGGGSVSIDFRDEDAHIISDKEQTARKLKSFWIVTEPLCEDGNTYTEGEMTEILKPNKKNFINSVSDFFREKIHFKE